MNAVQYLLLISQYLQGTQHSVQTWMIHGLAVKAGLSIGLHSNTAGRLFSPLEQEIRNRTWYGCILLDRSLSIAFGRPFNIQDEHIRIPPPQHWPGENDPISYQGEMKSPSTEFYIATVKPESLLTISSNLCRISESVVKQLYDGNLGCNTIQPVAELVPNLFSLEQDLSQWSLNLHEEVSLIQSEDIAKLSESLNPSSIRFRVVLTLRYLNVELLLHRHFVVRSLGSQSADAQVRQSSRSLEHLSAGAIQSSVRAAQESISIVQKILARGPVGRRMLGAWWFTLFYALTIFSIALIDPSRSSLLSSLTDSPETIAMQNMTAAIDALDQLDLDNIMVTRCKNYLEYLYKVLELRSRVGLDWALTSDTTLTGEGAGGSSRADGTSQLCTDALFTSLDFADILNSDSELGRYFITG
ncbi:hypothetical protein E4T39_05706 [Aureobasidium subglaciale]|nr:hypothetical protein E4T39_05706 [Aureobasidium subglaciale]